MLCVSDQLAYGNVFSCSQCYCPSADLNGDLIDNFYTGRCCLHINFLSFFVKYFEIFNLNSVLVIKL